LGAIKIMHKLLGDIIDDHKESKDAELINDIATNIVNLDDKK